MSTAHLRSWQDLKKPLGTAEQVAKAHMHAIVLRQHAAKRLDLGDEKQRLSWRHSGHLEQHRHKICQAFQVYAIIAIRVPLQMVLGICKASCQRRAIATEHTLHYLFHVRQGHWLHNVIERCQQRVAAGAACLDGPVSLC